MSPEETLLHIDGIEGRASAATCRKGGYDFRRYSEALIESGYACIPQWCAGQWDAASMKEFQRLIATAILHGSFPMLAVVGIFAADIPHLFRAMYQRLPKDDRLRLESLVKIGSQLDSLGFYILQIKLVVESN